MEESIGLDFRRRNGDGNRRAVKAGLALSACHRVIGQAVGEISGVSRASAAERHGGRGSA
jgi:hypothetical protein